MANPRLGRVTALAAALAVLAGCARMPEFAGFDEQPPEEAVELPTPGDNPAAAACVLIDTDMALDDVRAIAAMLPTGKVRAIVTTGGVSRPENGGSAAAVLTALSRRDDVRVLVGKPSPAPTSPDWLPASRQSAERLGYFLATTVPLGPPETFLAEEVRQAMRGCQTIDVLMLAPWSSFTTYRPQLGTRLRRIIVQGVPPTQAGSLGFSCGYDRAACQSVLQGGLFEIMTWVALPENADDSFVPRPDMFNGLAATGLPGAVKAMMQINPSAVNEGYVWDDSAALYWLYPDLFGQRGGHVEPVVPAATLKQHWRYAVNEAIERQY
ncbi:MAG TPA: hypothetical protein VNS22_06840 [Geminicoccus sp.]|uniref:hypothetical protein n=1 Tax=Geminicoccus sp. TaxID=2024832 RepID=UPI002BD92DF2|nr:hypothetical protein [Geminicoccus sp.]HWL68086.1 hypothetical protein [Geminicoccus sp.]